MADPWEFSVVLNETPFWILCLRDLHIQLTGYLGNAELPKILFQYFTQSAISLVKILVIVRGR